MQIDFCPELQIQRSTEGIRIINLNEIKIVLVECVHEKYPEILGRHGRDILTWPVIFSEHRRVELSFRKCVYFNIREEFSPGIAENDVGEGKQFQRLLESELVSTHKERGMDNLIHYRINTTDEIIDILVHEPPNIIKRNFSR